MGQSFDAGKCDVMAMGIFDIRFDRNSMNEFCKRDVVFTKGLVIEVPMAFPVKKELAAGLSHWFLETEKQFGITFEKMYDPYQPEVDCSVEVGTENINSGGIQRLTPNSMAFPLLLLSSFALMAIIVKLCNRKNTMKLAQFIVSKARLSGSSAQYIYDMAKVAHVNIDDIEAYERDELSEDDESETDELQNLESSNDMKRNKGIMASLKSSRALGIVMSNDKDEFGTSSQTPIFSTNRPILSQVSSFDEKKLEEIITKTVERTMVKTMSGNPVFDISSSTTKA